MIALKLLAILILAAPDVYGFMCRGYCGQGEGDCDRDKDCYDGLVCEFDGWWGTDFCRAGPDTVDGSWSEWGEYGECSVECGADGIQERFRTCNPPVKGGWPCKSQMDSSTQTCNNGPCPVNGGLGDWTDWEICPVSCGGADQGRTRACDSPAPEFGGDDCIGDTSEAQRCNENPCPIHGAFSDWDDWGPCIGIGALETTCGGGDQTRSRRCDNPAPQYGGLDCEGELTECQRCNQEPCPTMCPPSILRV